MGPPRFPSEPNSVAALAGVDKTPSTSSAPSDALPETCSHARLARLRELAIARYALDNPASWTTVLPCLSVAHAYFKKPCFAAVVHEDRTLYIGGKASPYEAGQATPGISRLCEAAVTSGSSKAFEVQDTTKDARFNSWSDLPCCYVAQPVVLTPSVDEEPIPTCVICLHDDVPFELSRDGRDFLADLAGITRNALKNRWARERQSKSEEMESCIQELLALLTKSEEASPPAQADFGRVARQVRSHLASDFVAILDLSAFDTVWSRVIPTPDAIQEQSDAGWLQRSTREHVSEGHAFILARSDSSKTANSHIDYNDDLVMQAIATFLKANRVAATSTSGGRPEGALRLLFPPAATAYFALPLYSLGKPDLLFLVSSCTPHRIYEREDLTFVSNVAVLLQSQLNNRRLNEVDRAKTEFVSNVSHELRTPLYGLMSQIELLRDFLNPDELSEVAPLLETAEVCGMTLKDILNDVLDFGKMENNRLTYVSDDQLVSSPGSTVNLCRLLVEVMNLAYTKSSRLQAVMGDSHALPQLAAFIEEPWTSWEAAVDAAALRRILINLLSNSLKYTKEGSISLTMRTLETPHMLEHQGFRLTQFCVADTGIGISDEFQKKLFTPFLQENPFANGAGLGLNMVRNIVKNLAGDITIRSKAGVGTEVRVNLPIRFSSPAGRNGKVKFYQAARDLSKLEAHGRGNASPLAPSSNRASSPASDPTPTTSPTPALKVLVADDNSVSRKVLTTLLARKSIAYEEAEDGMVALEKFKQLHPHLVFTDVSMPRMDGVTSAREMRLYEEQAGLRPAWIVALTGLSQSNVHEDLAAINEWLTKGGQTNLRSLAGIVDRIQHRLDAPASR